MALFSVAMPPSSRAATGFRPGATMRPLLGYGHIEKRLTGDTDHQNTAQAQVVELLDHFFGLRKRSGGYLSEAGPNRSATGLHHLADTRRLARFAGFDVVEEG